MIKKKIKNEVIDLVDSSKKVCLFFKVDFEKIYDSISLSFLDYILYTFGFHDKWMSFVSVCVFVGNVVVWVHAYSTRENNIHKGLKQRDPLTLFFPACSRRTWQFDQ